MDFKTITKDLLKAEELFFNHGKMLMVIGSARTNKPEDYKEVFEVTARIASAGQFTAVMTGGGPAVMQAANDAAFHMTNVKSLGCGIELPFEQELNEFVEVGHDFEHFFTRKYAMVHSADALLAFKGGVGTMDELFEIITLIQTEQMPKIPIVLWGRYYWTQVINWDLMVGMGVISKKDLELFNITDNIEEAVECLKN